MNIAILKYEFLVSKPDGIPDAWPAEIRELGESETLPGEDWVLMTQEAYDSYVAANQSAYDAWAEPLMLPSLKMERILEIDAKTRSIIDGGFIFDNHNFSLSTPAQINWAGLFSFKDLLSWPMNVTTIDDCEYSLTLENLSYFVATGVGVIKNAIDTGRALKLEINEATTIAELNSIVDSR